MSAADYDVLDDPFFHEALAVAFARGYRAADEDDHPCPTGPLFWTLTEVAYGVTPGQVVRDSDGRLHAYQAAGGRFPWLDPFQPRPWRRHGDDQVAYPVHVAGKSDDTEEAN